MKNYTITVNGNVYDVVVEEGAVVNRALVANDIHIGKNAVVGSADSEHIELVAKRVKGAE